MAKYEPKTRVTDVSPASFIDALPDEAVRADCRTLVRLMTKITGKKPKMWGPSIVGFGSYHLKYASGQELDWPIAAFSPRKQNLTLYITSGFSKYDELLARLGKHTTGKACLYVKRLADVDMKVLERIVTESARHMEKTQKL